MALCICGVRWPLPWSQDDAVGSQLHFKCCFIQISCPNTARLGKTWEEAAAKSNLFTSSLPLQSLDCCGQPWDDSTWWKWSGKSVPPLSCASRCCCAGHGMLLKAWNLHRVSWVGRELWDAWINNRHCSCGCVVWHTPLHTCKVCKCSPFSLSLERVHLILWNSWQNIGKVFYVPLTAFL